MNDVDGVDEAVNDGYGVEADTGDVSHTTSDCLCINVSEDRARGGTGGGRVVGGVVGVMRESGEMWNSRKR